MKTMVGLFARLILVVGFSGTVAAGISLSIFPAGAAETNYVSAALRLSADDLSHKETRITAITRVMSYCDHISENTPHLSPSENEWLDREFNSWASSRLDAAAKSPEFALRWVVGFAERCASDSRLIVTGQLTGNQEAVVWSNIASGFTRASDAEFYMERLTQTGEVEFSHDESHAAHYLGTSIDNILDKIVAPHLVALSNSLSK